VLDWLWGHTLASFQTVTAEVPVGAEVLAPDVLNQFALVVEGLFRSEARFQYPDWPSGATTDGSSIHICWRSSDESIDAVGLTCFGFGPDVFPFRPMGRA
jgi:hypothetical protein